MMTDRRSQMKSYITEKLNVRSTPGTDGELVGTVLKNERYVV